MPTQNIAKQTTNCRETILLHSSQIFHLPGRHVDHKDACADIVLVRCFVTQESWLHVGAIAVLRTVQPSKNTFHYETVDKWHYDRSEQYQGYENLC